MANSGSFKPGKKKVGGRKAGVPNKATATLKDMILQALDQAHPKGGVEYLKEQANKNPGPFLALVGKVLPMQVTGDGGGPLTIKIISFKDVESDG